MHLLTTLSEYPEVCPLALLMPGCLFDTGWPGWILRGRRTLLLLYHATHHPPLTLVFILDKPP
jgi:hypothetical protein